MSNADKYPAECNDYCIAYKKKQEQIKATTQKKIELNKQAQAQKQIQPQIIEQYVEETHVQEPVIEHYQKPDVKLKISKSNEPFKGVNFACFKDCRLDGSNFKTCKDLCEFEY